METVQETKQAAVQTAPEAAPAFQAPKKKGKWKKRLEISAAIYR